MKPRHFNLVIVGAGSAGLTAARTAASFGISVALIERHKIGGDCLHTGCVPSKSLISVARKIREARSLSSLMPLEIGALDYDKLHQYVHQSIDYIEETTDNPAALETAGVTVLEGDYQFVDGHTLADKRTTVTFKKCIIATGSQPVIPDLSGLKDTPFLTSDTLWDIKTLPNSLAILGAGPIGLELGQAFSALGTTVTIFEQGPRLVPRLGMTASRVLQDQLELDGVTIAFGSKVTGVQQKDQDLVISYEQHESKLELPVERLLVAVGRMPRTAGLNLASAGINVTERGGIIVDDHLRTSSSHIYAVGDCIGGPYFTHWAAEQGAAAVIHAIYGVGRGPDAKILPSATFTTPEISQVGASEAQLETDGIIFSKLILNYNEIDKAIAEHELGTIELLLDVKLRVLGATIIGANAAELIGYFVIVMNQNKPVTFLSSGVQAYPTYTINLKKLAADVRIEQLKDAWYLKLLAKIRGMG